MIVLTIAVVVTFYKLTHSNNINKVKDKATSMAILFVALLLTTSLFIMVVRGWYDYYRISWRR